jgi:hypothetical protein
MDSLQGFTRAQISEAPSMGSFTLHLNISKSDLEVGVLMSTP